MEENNNPIARDLLDIVNAGLEAGLEHPLTVVFIGANGSVSVSRFSAPGREAEALCEHIEEPGFMLPVTVLVVDPDGHTSHGLLESSGRPRPAQTCCTTLQ
jgi:hypothetical protein